MPENLLLMQFTFNKKYILSSILMGAWLVFGPSIFGQDKDTLKPMPFDDKEQTAIIEGDIEIDTAPRGLFLF